MVAIKRGEKNYTGNFCQNLPFSGILENKTKKKTFLKTENIVSNLCISMLSYSRSRN